MTDQKRNRELEKLIIGHFDGNLSEAEELKLATQLVDCPEAKQLFLSYMRLEGRLLSMGRDGFLREPGNLTDTQDFAGPMSSSHQPNGAGRVRSRVWAASTSLAAVAVVLLMVNGGLWPSSVNASSVLEKAKLAAAAMVDRTYHVTIVASNSETEVRKELTISLRGGGCFLVQPADGRYAMGYDGVDYWMFRKQGPVWVTSDFRALTPEIQRRIPNRPLLEVVASPHEPLLLDISSLLELVEDSYDIELVETSDSTLHHIRATPKRGKRSNLTRIDFWADANSGVLIRSEMTRVGRESKRQASFELVESASLSGEWYSYTKHAPGREIERVESSDSE